MLHKAWTGIPGLCSVCVICLLLAVGTSAADSLSDLTGPWQLFVDNSIVTSMSGLTRSYHAFEKHAGNPVLQADKPWEGESTFVSGTVLPTEDHSGYRIWYRTYGPGPPSCYATSTDGIHWTKPALGIISYNGSTANNMYTTLGTVGSVVHTPFNTNPNRRYTFLAHAAGRFMGAWSGDGVHWSGLPNNPLNLGDSDVAHVAWDPLRGRYLAYVKLHGYLYGLQRRAVGFSTTTDFISWPDAYLILVPDPFDDRWVPSGTIQRTHFYALNAFAYESMYLGLLLIFRATDSEGYYDGPVFVELISSRDGIHWAREEGDRPPIVAQGPAGAWDSGMVFTATHPLKEGSLLRLYYSGWDQSHGGAAIGHAKIGLATLRKDGFASLDAGPVEGTVTTRKLPRVSAPLHVNYRASGGWLRVEVLDENGLVMPGYSRNDCTALQGDSTDQLVNWTGGQNLPASPGLMRFRFILQNASLFSFNPGGAVGTVIGPVITQQPLPLTACPGVPASLTVQATGTGVLAYQWRKNDLNLTNDGHYSGATGPTLVLSDVNSGDAGTYACIVTDNLDSVLSPTATLTLGTSTTITQQPVSRYVYPGTTVMFAVSATGGGTLTYQWQKDNTNLGNGGHYSGCTTAVLTVVDAGLADAAGYRCVVTAECGSRTSETAVLATAPPGDFDLDTDVDLDDFGHQQLCLTGWARPQGDALCQDGDLDGDGDVDGQDIALFLGCMSGAGVPAALNCAD